MGFITELANKASHSRIMDMARSQSTWREVFGDTDKERRPPPVSQATTGRSLTSTEHATKRLLQALRSMAPGGWSDNRWEQSNHFTGMVYVAVDRISRQLAQSEFQVFRKDPTHPKGKRPVDVSEPPEGGRLVRPYQLVELLQKPNRQDSFGKMMWRWSQQLRLTGSALTWMVPNRLGVPMELYCIPTATAVPQPAVNPDFPDGYYRIQPVYPYGPFSTYPSPAASVGAAVSAEWMLRFQYPHPILRYDGYSPLSGGRLHIDEIESIDRSRWYSMKNSGNPSAVLNFEDMEEAQPLPQAEVERIHAEWEENFASPENSGRLLVTTPGAKLDPWGQRPLDMDYPAGWDQLASFILGGVFGITKPAAGMIEDSSYSSLFATLKQLHLVTLKPDCDDIASELTRHLAHFFGDDLIVEIRAPRIDDHEVKERKLRLAMDAKCITKNQMLDELDLPMTEEPWGEDMAGDPSPMEQEQMQDQMVMDSVAGPMGKLGGDGGSPDGMASGSKLRDKGDEEDPKEISLHRPRTGRLGEGSFGRKKPPAVNGTTRNGEKR